MADSATLDRNLALDAVRVCEHAALATSRLTGRGDEKAADQMAVNAMRDALNEVAIDGTVVIGEGERDKAPMLYIGEQVGAGGPGVDIALDPLEGTTITAKGGANALAVLALAPQGTILNAPDTYMQKIAVGGDLPAGVVDLDADLEANLKALAEAKGKRVEDLSVCVLDRPRHSEIIDTIRRVGARAMLIKDGDVAGVIATTRFAGSVDMYIGTGGAPEGVLAASALACIGGQMQGRLVFRDDDERARAERWGITDFDRKYELPDMVSGDVIFTATGVTDGNMVHGVHWDGQRASTESVVMRAATGTVRHIRAEHDLRRKIWSHVNA
ncbi:fructose-1,6-bisphosphatase II / sedoheptulose-1,7-bisphosphatase [Limimonas halophila]|uniref:Fructose-1,6-bisphosphatase n=1 Tax=Limimonas halophila TaxID=1082479 RepID=A0A1G7NS18_9PROT|nr:class II fructose-bisphosphatase [Limimonas halophila]SDF76040.1 fructose-1,6-bisphosphatase II / sedoheptulose-1,7-bisphosphatase [Limimonas halophila]